jgi:DNA polymerase III subunit epsilon
MSTRSIAESPHQRSFDDLGTPLHDVTFCVIDLETTGGNRNDDMITEIGAVRVRGGECLGTFQTLVNPGRAIPRRSPCSPASPTCSSPRRHGSKASSAR